MPIWLCQSSECLELPIYRSGAAIFSGCRETLSSVRSPVVLIMNLMANLSHTSLVCQCCLSPGLWGHMWASPRHSKNMVGTSSLPQYTSCHFKKNSNCLWSYRIGHGDFAVLQCEKEGDLTTCWSKTLSQTILDCKLVIWCWLFHRMEIPVSGLTSRSFYEPQASKHGSRAFPNFWASSSVGMKIDVSGSQFICALVLENEDSYELVATFEVSEFTWRKYRQITLQHIFPTPTRRKLTAFQSDFP